MGKHFYEAVIFDLDGVLTDTAHFHYLAWRKLAMSVDVSFDAVFNEQLKGVDRMGSLDLILARSGATYTQEEKLALADGKNRDYQELIRRMTSNDLLPGAEAALKAVRDAGLKVGLASVSKNAFFVLDRLGIREQFDYVVDAATLSRSKPDPEIFLTAAAKLGVAPSACIGVEDSVAGLQSIKSAGMYAIGIGNPQILTQADRVIPGLEQFRLSDYLAG